MDIAPAFDPETLSADVSCTDGGAVLDESLNTAAILSLFTDLVAGDDYVHPPGEDDPRG